MGVGTVADSLAAIKQLVFEDKRVTASELMEAIRADWQGYDALYHLVNGDKVHHYGNDDDYADELARYATDVYCAAVEGRPNPRGGVYQPGVYTVSANVPFGTVQAATPDGRKAHEPLSDCLGPVHTAAGSHDRKGPTAVINSAGKLDQQRMSNGTLLNLRFCPSSVAGPSGVQNLVSLARAYFARGMHMPSKTMVELIRLSLATVVRYFLAIRPRFSPRRTLWVEFQLEPPETLRTFVRWLAR